MNRGRREFLAESAALLAALGWEGCVSFCKMNHHGHRVAKGYELPGDGAAHVVVKVRPDGTYCVHLVEARDESMRVLAKFERRA